MNAIVTTTHEEKGLTRITNYLEASQIQKRFSDVLGERGAKTYVASVLIAVAESRNLQKCAPDSIYISALRAATLRLSVDASTGQAYLVPFGDRATLIVGYKGLHDMAVRTNRYKYINVAPVYANEIVTEDRMTGLHSIKTDTGFRRPIEQEVGSNGYEIIGWIGAFQMVNGYSHTLYMTCEECQEHGKKYSKGYDYKDSKGEFTSLWHKEPKKMERKTVLRLLLRKWGFLDPADVQQLNAVEDEAVESTLGIDNSIVEAAEVFEKEKPRKPQSELMRELGFDNPDPVKETRWSDWAALCEKADALGVTHPNPSKENTTDDDLAMGFAELLEYVKAAEYQAQAGTEAQ